ncbi:MAG: ATP-binding protein [Pseudomonadota bacterium]
MNETSLFHEEEEIVRTAEELLASEPRHEVLWPSHYQDLLSGFRKLLKQANLLVNVGDLMQNDLNEKNEQLKSARERERRLYTQFFQAQKMEAVGTLAGGIAHDFNNLLTIMNGYTELILSEKTEDDPIYADLQKILVTGLKGAEMVQRLLAFSKKGESNPEPLDLNHMVENASKVMERTFPKMIEIETLLGKDLGMVNADVSEVEQVLMNLCINAKEAMPEGGKLRIETGNAAVDEDYCRLHPEGKPGGYVLIAISDTGKGMSRQMIERMFDPFFTTKGWDFNKGTGLGLSVARGIVEQHGGWINCESEPGKGTTFRLYFPIVEESPADRKPQPLVDTVPEGEKILLVDDEEYVRDLGKRILEREGYEVIVAANGGEALQIYANEQSSIALVILDLIMPQMGGRECFEEILKINPEVKVLIASGFAVKDEAKAFLDAESKGMVSKPFNMRDLLRSVRQVLDKI